MYVHYYRYIIDCISLPLHYYLGLLIFLYRVRMYSVHIYIIIWGLLILLYHVLTYICTLFGFTNIFLPYTYVHTCTWGLLIFLYHVRMYMYMRMCIHIYIIILIFLYHVYTYIIDCISLPCTYVHIYIIIWVY